MSHEKDLLDRWTEYAVLKTAREKGIEEGMEKGMKKGMEKGMEKVIGRLLATKKFTIAEIADYAEVSESFVKKVKASIKKSR